MFLKNFILYKWKKPAQNYSSKKDDLIRKKSESSVYSQGHKKESIKH